MAQLNAIQGLFKVTQRVCKLCGFSLANITSSKVTPV